MANSRDSTVRWTAALAAVVLILAVPVATWWLVGDRSTAPAGANADYVIRPFDIGRGSERAAGVAAIVLSVVALLLLVWATRRRHLDARWWGVLIPLLVAGLVVGSGWRVLTAGVIGANIGAGFVVMLGGPAVAVLVIWALAYSIHLVRRRAEP